MRARGPVRGQATTELALASVVFTTLLLMGIHYGELPMVMLKVKEAAAYAAFDVTAHRTHLFTRTNISSGNTFEPFDPAAVGVRAHDRYRDFDGMSDVSHSGSWHQALTEARLDTLRCRADNSVQFGTQFFGGVRPQANAAYAYVRNMYRNEGGASCEVQATVRAFRVPGAFVEGNRGFAQATLQKISQLQVCGVGMPTNGTCRGRLAVLSGDWAFDGPVNSPPGNSLNGDVNDVQDNDIDNPAYETAVKELFDRNGGPLSDNTADTPGRHLMRVGAGLSEGDPEWFNETAFNMSFMGDRARGDHVEIPRRSLDPADSINSREVRYQTSGAHLSSSYLFWDQDSGELYGMPRCYLGLYGCRKP